MIPLQTPLPDFDPAIAEEFGYQIASGPSFLGVPLMETQSLMHLLIRFAFNLLVSWVIVHFLYYRKSRRRDFYFTFLLFSSAMFLLIFLMESVKVQIGLALGLFAIFGVIRYRTETVPIREMTYLFIIIALSVINGLSLDISYMELVVANLLIVGLIWFVESSRWIKHTSTKLVQYDRIELIKPSCRQELKEDLEQRLGFPVERVEIGHVDFLKDSAFIKVYYTPQDGEASTIENVTKAKDYVE